VNNSTPYFHGFEDAAENSQWTLVNNAANLNSWVINSAVSSHGQNSLYITPNRNLTPPPAGHNATIGYVSAYRDFTLEGMRWYHISFEWMNPSTAGELYVLWYRVQGASANPPASPLNALQPGIPAELFAATKPWVPEDTLMHASSQWQTALFDYRPAGLPTETMTYRLVFVWVSSGSGALGVPAAVIDNVQVGADRCGIGSLLTPPSLRNLVTLNNLTYTPLENPDRGEFSWTPRPGGGATYDFKFYPINNPDDSVRIDGLTESNVTVPELEPGWYKVWTRVASCGTDANTGDNISSIWRINYVRVFSRLRGCVAYYELDSDHVIVRIGSFNSINTGNDTEVQRISMVDRGPGNSMSRVTIHDDPTETDPRTGGQLYTVPRGYSKSVRLGNWNTGAEAESVTYRHLVTEETAIILLNYALVLEDASHDRHQQPTFTFEILDAMGEPIDDPCGVEHFIVGYDGMDDGWYSGQGITRWREWRNFGFNLSRYMGQEVRIRLTTRDCSQGGHYGYAYFTLECKPARLEGVTCGDEVPTTRPPLEAPAGFRRYEWRLASDIVPNPNPILSTNQTFRPPTGQEEEDFVCTIFFGTNNCSFHLYANAAHRKVHTNFERPVIRYENCEAIVNLTNTSYTMTSRGRRGRAETFRWYLDGVKFSDEENPEPLTFTEADTHTIRLIAGILNEQCAEPHEFTITIPEFRKTEEEIEVDICGNEYGHIVSANRTVYYTTSGLHRLPLRSIIGDCDSTIVIDLRLNPVYPIHIERDTLFLFRQNYFDYHGNIYTAPTERTDIFFTVHGCDSIVDWRLIVFEALRVELDSVPEMCHRNVDYFMLDYEVTSAVFTSFSVEFDQRAIDNGFVNIPHTFAPQNPFLPPPIRIDIPPDALPNTYTAILTFEDENNGDVIIPFSFTINYSSDVIRQKWNDVLMLRNQHYNGGFEFSSFQWYRNDELIVGETRSYLYVPGWLDFDAEYRVAIVRAGETHAVFTCPAVIEERAILSLYPTIVSRGESFTIDIPTDGRAVILNVMGLRVSEHILYSGGNQIHIHQPAGTYFVSITDEFGDQRTYTVLVK
jgi:hypothetical protein